MIAYKLLRQRADGSLGPPFIGRKLRLEPGAWLQAESIPTKGFALRPGFHTTHQPEAPHLSMKGRVWARVEIADFYEFERPANQGGLWYIAQRMRILEVLQ